MDLDSTIGFRVGQRAGISDQIHSGHGYNQTYLLSYTGLGDFIPVIETSIIGGCPSFNQKYLIIDPSHLLLLQPTDQMPKIIRKERSRNTIQYAYNSILEREKR